MHADLFECSAHSLAAMQTACGLATVGNTMAIPGALWLSWCSSWQPPAAILKMCGVFGAAPGSSVS